MVVFTLTTILLIFAAAAGASGRCERRKRGATVGVFDYVYVICPRCGRKNTTQVHVADSYMNHYDFETAPQHVLADLAGEEIDCKCGATLCFDVTVTATLVVRKPGDVSEAKERAK